MLPTAWTIQQSCANDSRLRLVWTDVEFVVMFVCDGVYKWILKALLPKVANVHKSLDRNRANVPDLTHTHTHIVSEPWWPVNQTMWRKSPSWLHSWMFTHLFWPRRKNECRVRHVLTFACHTCVYKISNVFTFKIWWVKINDNEMHYNIVHESYWRNRFYFLF